MGATTGIEWTDSTWSPVKGCSRISPGCLNCYAESLAGRFCGPGLHMEGFATLTPSGARWTGKVALAAERLDQPARWKEGRRIFVDSQSDTFHEKLTNEEIMAVFGAMAAAPHHTFLVLTKRAERMREWFRWFETEHVLPGRRFIVPMLCEHAAVRAERAREGIPGGNHDSALDRVADRLFRASNERAGVNTWPLPNVWLGASVEHESYLGRLEDLLRTPAVKHFASFEPLLGPLPGVERYLSSFCAEHDFPGGMCTFSCSKRRQGLGWAIVGGESGSKARPMHPDWARALRDQCQEAGVPFFFKQWGEWGPRARDDGKPFDSLDTAKHALIDTHGLPNAVRESAGEGYACMSRVGKKASGSLLDGREWKEFPS